MKNVAYRIMVIIIIFIFVGCGQNQEETEGITTLRFSWWGGDSRHSATLEMIEAFEASHPTIRIEPEFTGWSGHYDKIATQIAGQNEADIMQINYNWFYLFSPDGTGFADLSVLDNIDLTQWDQQYLDPLTIDGHVVGIPASVGGRLPYFNLNSYEAAGIGIPTTWDALIAAGDTFKETLGDDYYPLGSVSYTDDLNLIMFTYLTQMTGKPMIVDDQLAYTEEELLAGYDFVQSLFDHHVLPNAYYDSAEKNQQNIYWIEGRYAGTYQWNSSIAKYEDALNPNMGAELIPGQYLVLSDDQKHNGAYRKITMGFAISRHSKNKEAAAEFLNYMYTDEEAINILGLSRAVPVSKTAFEHLKDTNQLGGLQYEGHLIIEEASGYTYHPFYEDNAVKTAYYDVMNLFAYGDKISSAEAASTLKETFNVALSEAMSRGE